MDLFPDYLDSPEHVSFAHQEKDEKIELLLRQHWVTNLPWIFISLLGIFAPAIFVNVVTLLNLNFLLEIPENLFIGVLIVWYLLVFAYIIENYLHWYFNIYIVTNMHLVDVNFYSLLNRSVTENQLNDIQNVSAKIQGIIQSLFRFGDVLVETAGRAQNITFLKVPNPDAVADRIQDLQSAAELRP